MLNVFVLILYAIFKIFDYRENIQKVLDILTFDIQKYQLYSILYQKGRNPTFNVKKLNHFHSPASKDNRRYKK